MEWIYTLVPFILGIATQNIHIHSDCFGGGFMNASCPASQQIYPLQVIAGTKELSLNCSATYSTLDIDQCCKPEGDDNCTGEYVNVDNPFRSYQFHENCIGRSACPEVPVPNMDTAYLSCDQSLYPTQTKFMAMYYNCIDESKIAIINGTYSLQSNDSVYLQGANNDGEIPPFSVLNNSCSIEAPFCNSNLTIDVLDLRLADNSTDCKQSLIIVDGTRSLTLTCANNKNFNVISIPTQTNYITLTFQNVMTVKGGHFWLEFSGTSKESVQLHCPARFPDIDCTVSTSTVSPSTEAIPTTVTSTITTLSTSNQTVYGDTPAKNGKNNDMTLIIGVVVAVMLLFVAAVAAILYIRFKKKKRVSSEKSDGNEENVSHDIAVNEEKNSTSKMNGNDSGQLPPMRRHNQLDPIKITPVEVKDRGSSSKKKKTKEKETKEKKTKKKKKQKDKLTEFEDVETETTICATQVENAVIENEKSVKIQKKKKKKRKYPKNDPETPNLDQERGNSEINQSENNIYQEIQPSSGDNINGTSFDDEQGVTVAEKPEEEKRHKKSRKNRSKRKKEHKETAEDYNIQHESTGNEGVNTTAHLSS